MNKVQFLNEVKYLAENKDIHLQSARGWIEDGNNTDVKGRAIAKNFNIIAQDANLVGQANGTMPSALLSYWDPKAIEILTQKRSARDMFREVKKGNFASSQIHFSTEELVGSTQAYSDFTNSGSASVNYNFPYRQVYRFQTVITIGDLEAEMAGEAQISAIANKQRAALTMLDIDANKFYLHGVDGMQIYGILNDPSLPAAITPLSLDNRVLWQDKTSIERYNDILALFSELVKNMGGHVDASSKLVLALSPSLNVMLGAASDYNISVLDMLKKYFSQLRIVVVPELNTEENVQTICLYPEEVLGQVTGECIAPEKFRAYPAYRRESSTIQKLASATAGAVLYRPLAFVRMTGM